MTVREAVRKIAYIDAQLAALAQVQSYLEAYAEERASKRAILLASVRKLPKRGSHARKLTVALAFLLASAADAAPTHSVLILSNEGYVCQAPGQVFAGNVDPSTMQAIWVNPHGVPIFIKQVDTKHISTGQYGGGATTWANNGFGFEVLTTPIPRGDTPGLAIVDEVKTIQGDGYRLEPGWYVIVVYFCGDFAPNRGLTNVTIQYSVGTP